MQAPARASDPATLAVPVLAAPPAAGGVIDDSWSKAATLTLDQDFTYRSAAREPTSVVVAQDGVSLDVAFTVTQAEKITAETETNGAGVTADDYVGVYLFPQGSQGFAYAFYANPRGARYQTSSENSAYTPQWSAVGHRTATGYVVTMRIPLDVIRTGGSTVWKAQFVRSTVATNGVSVWAYSTRQTNAADPSFAGTLTDIGVRSTAAARPKPRAQLYTLGELTTPPNGGNTSRIGADFSIPVTPTASFVAALHPDFSNVEVDQQTISPTAFARQFAEVRPFFTQAASAFNFNTGCIDCPQTLYTPAIPTFRDGYAVEGTQGRITFGAFDSVGYGRSDAAQAVDYNVSNDTMSYGVNVQRVAVDFPSAGIHDDVTSISTGYVDNRSHLLVYGNAGADRGTLVTDASQANYFQAGFGYADATSTAILFRQRIGAQFAPVDGFVAQTDLAGSGLFANKTWTYSPAARIRDVGLNVYEAGFRDHLGEVAQRFSNEVVGLDFRTLLALRVSSRQRSVRTFNGEFLPFSSNGVVLGFRIATTTPSLLSYTGGAYYHGHLGSVSASTVLPIARSIKLSLESDGNQYSSVTVGEPRATQWLDRASLNLQFNRDASFDVGVRRIIGRDIPNAVAPPDFAFINAGNVTFAFHFLRAKDELYFVYGDPNSLATTPALFVKWIRYVGAPKGT